MVYAAQKSHAGLMRQSLPPSPCALAHPQRQSIEYVRIPNICSFQIIQNFLVNDGIAHRGVDDNLCVGMILHIFY